MSADPTLICDMPLSFFPLGLDNVLGTNKRSGKRHSVCMHPLYVCVGPISHHDIAAILEVERRFNDDAFADLANDSAKHRLSLFAKSEEELVRRYGTVVLHDEIVMSVVLGTEATSLELPRQ